eukprot:2234421-Ditylum_brightwellii.AAC.1
MSVGGAGIGGPGSGAGTQLSLRLHSCQYLPCVHPSPSWGALLWFGCCSGARSGGGTTGARGDVTGGAGGGGALGGAFDVF